MRSTCLHTQIQAAQAALAPQVKKEMLLDIMILAGNQLKICCNFFGIQMEVIWKHGSRLEISWKSLKSAETEIMQIS